MTNVTQVLLQFNRVTRRRLTNFCRSCTMNFAIWQLRDSANKSLGKSYRLQP